MAPSCSASPPRGAAESQARPMSQTHGGTSPVAIANDERSSDDRRLSTRRRRCPAPSLGGPRRYPPVRQGTSTQHPSAAGEGSATVRRARRPDPPIDHLALALDDPLTADDADAMRTVAATPWYPDLAAFLADPAAGTPDVVVVCTPIHTHFALASQALRAGCDVLLEKPPT